MAKINTQEFAQENKSYNTPDGKPPDHRQILLDLIANAHGPQAGIVADKAFKTQDKQIEQAMTEHGMTAEDILKSKGIDINNPGKKQGNFFHTPFQMNKQTGEVTPESILGGLFKSTPEDTLRMAQASQLAKKSQGFNTEESISKGAELNKMLDEKMPGYQVTQSADGNFVIHPKAAGIMAQMAPEQISALSDSLVNGQIVPSQLPRIQKAQVVAAALEKNPDYSPAKADMEFAANKMGAGAFYKNYAALDSFHRDFEKNSDLLIQLSKDFDRSKSPILNRAIVAGAKEIKGDPKATRYLQALNTVTNGYARLQNPTLGGQALSDAARKEARDFAEQSQTHEQLMGLLDPQNGSMRKEAQNRIEAAKEVKDELSSKYDKSSSSKENVIVSKLKSKYGLE